MKKAARQPRPRPVHDHRRRWPRYCRGAGIDAPSELRGDFEILALAGLVAPDGAHLHMSVSDAPCRGSGGHVANGCVVRTTAEILLVLLPAHRFSREPDAGTGLNELVIRLAAD